MTVARIAQMGAAAAPRADDGAAAARRFAHAVDRRESHGAAHGRLAHAERAGRAELRERAAARRALRRVRWAGHDAARRGGGPGRSPRTASVGVTSELN